MPSIHTAIDQRRHYPDTDSLSRTPRTCRVARTGTCAWVLVAMLCMMSLLGCSRALVKPHERSSQNGPQSGGNLTLATMYRPRTLDPAVAFDEASDPILRLIFARLFRVSRSGQIQGDLVEHYTLSQDSLVLKMQLRSDARFHDGSKVTGQDVVRSMHRALHPKTPCPSASFFERIKGFDDYRSAKAANISGLTAPSETTVRIELTKPDASLLALLTLAVAAPVCPSTPVESPAPPTHKPCGAGPFQVVDYRSSDSIHLARFTGYHRKRDIYLNNIHWLFAVASTSQRYRLELAQIDLVHELSTADAIAFRADPTWSPLGHWSQPRNTRSVFMNTELAPFNDVRMRQAVALAIDRSQIASLRAGHLVVANSVIPAGVLGHDPTFEGVQTNISKALELMEQAGFSYDPKTQKGGYPHPISYYCAAESMDVPIGELLQQQLSRIGIRLQIKSMAWPAYLAVTSERGRAQMGSDGWTADFDDPSDFFDPLFSSRSITDRDSQNRAFFSNSTLDQYLDEARNTTDPAVRKRLYHEAERIVRDEAPWAVIYGSRYYDVHQGYVRGYTPHPYMPLDVSGVWIDAKHKELARAAKNTPFLSVRALAAQLARWTNQRRQP